MDSYTHERVELIRAKTGASDVHYDLLGITLTIDGQVISLPYDVVRALSHFDPDFPDEPQYSCTNLPNLP